MPKKINWYEKQMNFILNFTTYKFSGILFDISNMSIDIL